MTLPIFTRCLVLLLALNVYYMSFPLERQIFPPPFREYREDDFRFINRE